MHWRTVVRLDPIKGETIRGFAALEETVRAGASEYYGEAFGRNSFSGNEANRAFFNLGGGRQFADLTGVSGLGHRGDGRTFVTWDYDRDGWTDIASINTNAPQLRIEHNEIGKLLGAGQRNLIAIEFHGGNHGSQPSAEFSNRDGYGARVTIEIGTRKLVREHHCGQGAFAQNSARMLVGIGAADTADRITIRWPSGKTQQVEEVEAGTLLRVSENPADGGIQQSSYRQK